MPNMNSGNSEHSLVVVKNKLFVISNSKDNCEVYDNICKKFTTIKSPRIFLFSSNSACRIKHKIFVLRDESSKIIFYDTIENEWSKESCEVINTIYKYSSIKVSCL